MRTGLQHKMRFVLFFYRGSWLKTFERHCRIGSSMLFPMACGTLSDGPCQPPQPHPCFSLALHIQFRQYHTTSLPICLKSRLFFSFTWITPGITSSRRPTSQFLISKFSSPAIPSYALCSSPSVCDHLLMDLCPQLNLSVLILHFTVRPTACLRKEH